MSKEADREIWRVYASAALQGVIANDRMAVSSVGKFCTEYADEMLKAEKERFPASATKVDFAE